VYREKLEAYALALDRATEVWCSTPALAKSLAGEVSNQIVIPNSIDPRLWRQYRRPLEIPVRDGPPGLQILYAGTATHGADFVELLSVFDELAAKVRFGLSVVGVADDLPERRWLRRLRPGRDTLYPRYARWLRGLGPLFDVGIAPLADTEFNQLKSDIKLLEYLAIGVVPLLSDLDPYSESDLAVSSMLHSGPDEWSSELERLGTDGRALFAAKDVAYSQREVMWGTRSAAQTGAMMANRLADLVDRTG
jgi:glycosyltransferase involved in cell wall biosynthesis